MILELTKVQEAISNECDLLKVLLLEKNRKYGNSALEPKRVFSKAPVIEQLLVRIDDKLSRIATSGESDLDEDTVQDLMGYLILLRVARRQPPISEVGVVSVLGDASNPAPKIV